MAQLTPLWLGDLLAAVVIATAVYCGARIVYAKVRNRATHDDVDALHVLMGVAMAGMLTAHLADLAPVRGTVHAAWVTVFALCTAWFGYRAVRQRGQTPEHGSGPAVHLVGSAAMLYMLAVATSGGAMAGAAMSGASDGAARLPELGILLAVLATGAAVLILDRITVAAPSPVAVPAVAGVPAMAAAAAPAGPAARRILAPRAAEGCHLAMCVIMAYMLIAMFA
jgi:Domain of unknown function (DUF5134)